MAQKDGARSMEHGWEGVARQIIIGEKYITLKFLISITQ